MNSPGRLCVSLSIVALSSVAARGQVTERASVSSSGTQGNGASAVTTGGSNPCISSDGRYVAFCSDANNLVAGDTNGTRDVFVHDRQTGQTVRVSVSSSGIEGNGPSPLDPGSISISADGRFVAFSSRAANLDPGGITGGLPDVFVHDRDDDADGIFDEVGGIATTRVSVDSSGIAANGGSGQFGISLSADGRFVAFVSDATNLVVSDLNSASDVFRHDRQTGQTELVDLDSSGGQSEFGGVWPALSADGRFVAFLSSSANLVGGDSNGVYDVFVRDTTSAQTVRVSVDSSGIEANGASETSAGISAAISADGRFVAFSSEATNLVGSDLNGLQDVFVHDRDSDGNGTFDEAAGMATVRISTDSAGTEASGGDSFFAGQMSPDGRFVTFTSRATNLVGSGNDTNSSFDVFLADRDADANGVFDEPGGIETTRASVDSSGIEGNSHSDASAISSDGSIIAFRSFASNLVAADTNGVGDVFIRDRRPCGSGNVNAMMGPPAFVLFANASAGNSDHVVVASVGTIALTFGVSPSGPASTSRYLLWAWHGVPVRQSPLRAHNVSIGCTMNPTQFNPGDAPQPFKCFRGPGIPSSLCGSLGPPAAPWTRNFSVHNPITVTLQGIVQDIGASNSLHVSITNELILKVH